MDTSGCTSTEADRQYDNMSGHNDMVTLDFNLGFTFKIMAAALLIGFYDNCNEDGEQHEHQNVITEGLLFKKEFLPSSPFSPSLLSNPSPAVGRLFLERSSVRDTENESDCCVSDSGQGSGIATGHSGRSALCSLQTGRAEEKKAKYWMEDVFHFQQKHKNI